MLLQDSACGTGDSDANEAKYNRLKSRYRQACDAHAEEVDRLNDEVAALQQHILKLDAARYDTTQTGLSQRVMLLLGLRPACALLWVIKFIVEQKTVATQSDVPEGLLQHLP